MKRALLFIFMTVCVLGMSACSSKDAMPETSDSASNPVQNTDISNLNGGKIWSEQDIVSMFSLVQETDWEYIDCVLIPDHAVLRMGLYSFFQSYFFIVSYPPFSVVFGVDFGAFVPLYAR